MVDNDALINDTLFFTFYIKGIAYAVPLYNVELIVEIPEFVQNKGIENIVIMNIPYKNETVKVIDFLLLQRNESTKLGIRSSVLILKKHETGVRKLLGIVIESINGIVEIEKKHLQGTKKNVIDKYINYTIRINGINHNCIDTEKLMNCFQ
jgi:chemotaxis signal transduction protein